MAAFQGAPLPDITETTKKITEAPGYYTDYLAGLSAAGTRELAKTPDQLVAPLTAMQQQGYAQIPTAAAAYQPGLATAQQTAAQAAGIGPEDISRFMNPYTQNVVQEMERLAQQNIQRNVLPSLTAAAVGRGDLGSRRYATATGQSLADIQRGLTGQQYGALSAGYKQALDAATEEARLQNAVAQTQAKQAAMEQELGLAGATAMTKAGGEQQAYEQARLEAPLKAATGVSRLMQGQQVPLGSTQTFVGPKAGAYQTSDISRVMGLGTFLGSAAAGKAGSRIVDFVKALGVTPSGPGGRVTQQDIAQAGLYGSPSDWEREYTRFLENQANQAEDIDNSYWQSLIQGGGTSSPSDLNDFYG